MEKRLNLGCGDFPLEGFINIDIYEGKEVDLVCNILNLPFDDNSIEEIYAGHVIEHLTMSEAGKGLKEWIRVLKKGGQIGIVIPDKNLTPKNLLEGIKDFDKPYREHNSYWDLDLLRKEVSKVGFKDIEDMNIGTHPYLVNRSTHQTGIIAFKGGRIMKNKKIEKKGQVDMDEIPKFNPREESWCKYCKEVVYNFKLKLHCPQCGKLL